MNDGPTAGVDGVCVYVCVSRAEQRRGLMPHLDATLIYSAVTQIW